MMNPKYRWVHDCEKPEIPFETIKRVSAKRNWYGKKIQETWTEKIYKQSVLKWECECGARWIWYAPKYHKSYWFCEHRQEVWKELEL